MYHRMTDRPAVDEAGPFTAFLFLTAGYLWVAGFLVMVVVSLMGLVSF